MKKNWRTVKNLLTREGPILANKMFSRFFLLLLALFGFFTMRRAQQQNNSTSSACQPTGLWGDWGNWSACPWPISSVPSLNVQRRIRACLPQPSGCQPNTPFNCSGPYSEVKACNTSTIPAPISAAVQPQQVAISGVGGANFGGIWSASMVQSMQLSGMQLGSLNAGMAQAMQVNGTGK